MPRTLGKYNDVDILINKGRFGPYIKYGADFISMPKGEDPLEISLETVIDILSKPRLPRNAGKHEGKDVIVSKGRFGPYIKFDNIFVALKKTDDPFDVTLERLVQLIEDKKEGVKSGGAEQEVKEKKGKKSATKKASKAKTEKIKAVKPAAKKKTAKKKK